jgi:hypothetical protein
VVDVAALPATADGFRMDVVVRGVDGGVDLADARRAGVRAGSAGVTDACGR